MRFSSQKFKIIFSLLICVTFVCVFSLIKVTIKKTDSYNMNAKLITLYNEFNLNETFDIRHENLDKLFFILNNDEKNEKFSTLFKYEIESYDKYKIPLIPNLNYDNNRKSILFEITVDDKKYYKRVFLSDLEIGDNEINVIPKILKGIKYKIININIKPNNVVRSDGIKIYINESKSYATKTEINNKTIDNEMSCIMISHTLDIKMLICIIILTFIIFIHKNRKSDLFKDEIKDLPLFLIELILSIIFSISLLKFNINYSAYETISEIYLCIMIMSLFIISKLLLFGIKKYKKCLEKLFVLLALFVGTVFVFTMTLNGIPDENHHYYQSEKLSKLNFKKEPDYMIDKYFEMCIHENRTYKCMNEITYKLSDKNEKSVVKNTAYTYNPILYVPSALGIATGRILGFNLCIGYYIARMLNLLTAIIFGYFSIKLLKKGKLILFIYLLNPLYIQQAMGISADGITNAISLLFISYIFSGKQKYDKKDKIILTLLSICLCLIKRPYILLLLLLFTRKRNNIKIDNNLIKKTTYLLLLILLAYLIFTNLNYTVYSKYSLLSTLMNPYDFVSTFITTIRECGSYYFETLFGTKLGWLDINVNSLYVYAYFTMLLASTVLDEIRINKGKLVILLITFILVFFAIFYGFYSVYFDKMEGIIWGLQGRYFIPICILLLFAMSSFLNKFKLNINHDIVAKIFGSMALIINLLVIVDILKFYI